MGIANADKPELVILVVLYNPTGEGGHQGGAVASPTARKDIKRSTSIYGSKKRRRK